MGNSQREVAIIMYLWTAMFAFPTVIAAFYPLWISVAVGLSIALASLLMIWRSLATSRGQLLPANETEPVSHE